mmetsp:Transcript_51460/g.117014  ORF Transcript_51460/g.117014 Transcript_51460/m.117014 type:complete len:223 (-) Transcript_51460:77-745(-)
MPPTARRSSNSAHCPWTPLHGCPRRRGLPTLKPPIVSPATISSRFAVHAPRSPLPWSHHRSSLPLPQQSTLDQTTLRSGPSARLHPRTPSQSRRSTHEQLPQTPRPPQLGFRRTANTTRAVDKMAQHSHHQWSNHARAADKERGSQSSRPGLTSHIHLDESLDASSCTVVPRQHLRRLCTKKVTLSATAESEGVAVTHPPHPHRFLTASSRMQPQPISSCNA